VGGGGGVGGVGGREALLASGGGGWFNQNKNQMACGVRERSASSVPQRVRGREGGAEQT